MSTPVTPTAEGANPSKTVYEIWKAFDFEGTVGRYQGAYEKVINNMTNGVHSKQELIEYVRGFTNNLKGKATCDTKDIEALLGFFKTAYAGQLERAAYSEKSFTDFYKMVAELSDPTTHLLSATVLNATVLKLETELKGLRQQMASETDNTAAIRQLQENLKSEADRAESNAAHARGLEVKLEVANNEMDALKQKLSALTAQHDMLQEKTLSLTEELNRAQFNQDSKYEAVQEENTMLSQQLADALTRVQEMSKGSTQSIEAEVLAEEMMELRNMLSTKEMEEAVRAETITGLEQTVRRLEQELGEARRSRSGSHPSPAEGTVETSKLKKAMMELNIPKAEMISDEYDAAACMKELHDRNIALVHSVKGKEAEVEALQVQVKDLTMSLDTSNDSLMAMRERLHSINEKAGGGDEGFDLGRLVGSKEHCVVDIDKGASDDVSMLTSQRAALRQKITTLEARNDRLIDELDRVRRKKHVHTSSPPPPAGAHAQRQPTTAFDTFAHNIMKVLNTNNYTRAFAVTYIAFLHLFVFLVLFSLTKEYSDHRRVVERHSF